MKRGKVMIKRVNISFDEDLLNKIDSFSKKRYISRSGFISMVLSSYLDHVEKCQRIDVTSEEFRH